MYNHAKEKISFGIIPKGYSKPFLLLAGITIFGINSYAQSLEIMPGTERIFADAQWLKSFDENNRWMLFSRSRATVDYDNKTNLFTGAYLNYTTKTGIGGTIVGRIATSGAGGDAGIHFFKANNNIVIYALASVVMQTEFSYSWFSIFRYQPTLSQHWKLYTSLELFTNFVQVEHIASVQRVRAGLDRNGYQFGFAINLSGFGPKYDPTDTNPGLFFRKQF